MQTEKTEQQDPGISPLLEGSPPFNDGVMVHKGKFLVALIVLTVALGYFALMAFEGATVYYYTVAEMNDEGPSPEGKLIRVSGKLVADSFHRDDGSTLSEFSLTDGTETLIAKHSGILPDLFFNDHSEIILEGSQDSQGVFHSENVIVKCPSKYVAQDENNEQS